MDLEEVNLQIKDLAVVVELWLQEVLNHLKVPMVLVVQVLVYQQLLVQMVNLVVRLDIMQVEVLKELLLDLMVLVQVV